MNREIKFRVWDTKINKFLQQLGNYYHIPYGNFEEPEGEANLIGISQILNDSSFIVQQFIGVKDKNGKEIYEGDVLTDESGVYLKVFWHNNEPAFFIYDLKEKDEFRLSSFILDFVFVCGNIFENPELLKNDE